MSIITEQSLYVCMYICTVHYLIFLICFIKSFFLVRQTVDEYQFNFKPGHSTGL
jgi:hypothetical protein